MQENLWDSHLNAHSNFSVGLPSEAMLIAKRNSLKSMKQFPSLSKALISKEFHSISHYISIRPEDLITEVLGISSWEELGVEF